MIGLGDATSTAASSPSPPTCGITSAHCSSAAMHADRGHLAVPLPGRLLAARTGDDDRHRSGRRRAVGHQGQDPQGFRVRAARGAARDGVMVYCHASGSTLDELVRTSSAIWTSVPGDPSASRHPRVDQDVRHCTDRWQIYEPASGNVPQEDIWETSYYLDFAPEVMARLR